MIPIKVRKSPSHSRNKIVSAIELYEKFVDEEMQTINIQSSTRYLINSKYIVDTTTNKVNISYPDPE